MGTIAERILAVQGNITKLRDQLTEIMKDVDDDNPDEATALATEELTKKIEIQERHLETLKKAEKQLAVKTVRREENDDDDDETTTVEPVRQQQRGSAASALTISGKRPFAIPAKKVKPVDYLWRALTVQIKHHHQKGRLSMIDVLKETYGEDEGTHALMNVVCRATTAPATTLAQGWAADLVTVAIGEFFGLLIPTSIYAQLSSLGGRFTFGPNGILSMPTRLSTPTIAGAFVAQGAPIPVKQGAFSAVTMVPKKVGVISTFTREIAEHSTPSIEQLIRDAILEDTSIAIDAVLMGNGAATAIAPAGLGNGVSTLSATAGADVTSLIGDIKTITSALFSVTNGNVRTPVWIMPPGVANSAALSTTTTASGIMPFREEITRGTLAGYPLIKSTNAPADTWWLVDAADFVTATGDTPRFDVSDQAVLTLDDAPTQDIIAAGVAQSGTTTKSLWQTDSLGVRMIMDMNWIMRRAGMVLFTSGLNWNP
jgi:hypothetical protein